MKIWLLPVLVALPLILCSCGSSPTADPTPAPAVVEFTSYITDLSKISYIIQPGNSSGTVIEPRSYLAINRTESTLEVFAPTAGELIGIGYYVARADGVPEYALYFKAGGTAYYFFAHLIDVIPEISAAGPASPQPTSAYVTPTVPVSVTAGELIGHSEGTPQARTFDFGAYDTANKNAVANESRYSAEDRYLTGVNPYSYYSKDKRDAYLALTGNPAGTIVPTTECRNPCRDVPGTAAGYWHLDSGTDATYPSRMYVISEVDGSVYWGGVGGRDTDFKTASNIPSDPAGFTTGDSYQYSGSAGYLFIKLLSSTELGVYLPPDRAITSLILASSAFALRNTALSSESMVSARNFIFSSSMINTNPFSSGVNLAVIVSVNRS